MHSPESGLAIGGRTAFTSSGGEQQRVAFARAIVGRPAVVIADEPTAELDSANTHAILDVIHELNESGTTIVVATHDPIALERIDHVITLRDGRWRAFAETVLIEP
ncbi:MAG: ATP-binding cassette domain-containing protein [Acidimicrobiales bacterium]